MSPRTFTLADNQRIQPLEISVFEDLVANKNPKKTKKLRSHQAAARRLAFFSPTPELPCAPAISRSRPRILFDQASMSCRVLPEEFSAVQIRHAGLIFA